MSTQISSVSIQPRTTELIFSSSVSYGRSPYGNDEEWYPILQATDGQKEYYYLKSLTRPDFNPTIEPSQIKTIRDNGKIVSLQMSSNEDTEMYTLLKIGNRLGSTDNSHSFVLLKCKGVNLNTLLNYGRLVTFMKNGQNTLLLLMYKDEATFMQDFNLEVSFNDNLRQSLKDQ